LSQRHTDVPMPAAGGHAAATGPADPIIDEACPINEVLEHVAGKWSIGILVAAARGPIRFTQLERQINGISRRMLTLNLRKLERDGLLVRTVYAAVPPKVEYSLTPMARELHATLASLVGWAQRHQTAIAIARSTYDAAARSPDGADAEQNFDG
jgi:DNA-binding HxlR family transcriptional regulator